MTKRPRDPGSRSARVQRPAIGWREWVALPELGISRVKAKIDTGARSSAIHAFDVHVVGDVVHFKVHPIQRDAHETVATSAALLEHREVRNSGGTRTRRPVIVTPVRLGDDVWPIELTLVARDEMGFRMLLGREAVRGRYLVDPMRSFLYGGRPTRRKRAAKPDPAAASGPEPKDSDR